MENNLFGVCPFVTAQKLLQGKWAILVLHELSEGTKRFNELERAIKITHASLSAQLKYLEREGIVSRTVYPEVPPRVEYALTPRGESLMHHLTALIGWAEENFDAILEDREREKI